MIKEALSQSAPQDWEEKPQSKELSKRELSEFIDKLH